jgi:hypothetical protein
MRTLVESPEFQALYGSVFRVTNAATVKLMNDKQGWAFASSTRGVGTGERADYVLCDDLHNVKDVESDVVRQETIRFFRSLSVLALTIWTRAVWS